MRPWQLLPVVVLLGLPSGAAAQAGGAAAPEHDVGGAEYGTPVRKAPTRHRPLTASEFSATPATLQPGGAPVRFAYRIDGAARRVRVRIDVLRVDSGVLARRIRLGWKPTGVRRVYRWRLRSAELAPGEYVARLHASDGAGGTLVRTASASGRSSLSVAAPPPPVAPVTVGSGLFPVQGPYDFGGDDARFGAARDGHVHQGQDIMAAEGTPIVSPLAGYVRWKAYQASGAGHYLVIRGDDGRDYVFMHLVSGSIPVGKEDPVTAGMQIGQVGTTGDAQGAHLHFEIWPDGWYDEGSAPVDPRPQLDAWAGVASPAPA
jgi:murein DD-endopeptidase MepM/ murein hydrolase activator NlpD